MAQWRKWQIARIIRQERESNRNRSAADVFDQIYRQNIWGGESGDAFSGVGSTGAPCQQYVSLVNEFIDEHRIRTVLDIGCGDFRVGQHLNCEKYIGVDVAPSIIEKNRAGFGNSKREFLCLDAAGSDPLPAADLCLIRQVLQHLSNSQILAILAKLKSYRFAIVTEHQPSEEDFLAPNLDKIHGNNTRLYSGSGVYLDRPPFNSKTELLLEVSQSGPEDVHGRGKIRTFLMSDYTLPNG